MDGKQEFPPRLKTDLDRLYEHDGGPIELDGIDCEASQFGNACQRFPFASIAPLLRPFQSDDQRCRVHWPWVALVADQYGFEQNERATYEKLKPSEVKGLFENISGTAKTLAQQLERLRWQSNQFPDPKKPEASGHLAYLSEFFNQRALADIDTDFINDPFVQMGIETMHMKLVARLSILSAVADEFANNHVDQSLLAKTRGQDNPALPNLVIWSAKIWNSLTGRKPSASKIQRRDEERSDFVRFTCSIAALAGRDEPTSAEIGTALSLLSSPH